MEKEVIILSLKEIQAKISSLLRLVEPEKCECHERDSSQVCNFCHKLGYRGHMEEDGSFKCENCDLWSYTETCDYCGYSSIG